MNLYLAGPMTHKPEFGRPVFAEHAERLRAAGHEVTTPHDMDADDGWDWTGFAGTTAELDEVGFNRDEAMRRNVDLIANVVDAVAVLPGWDGSTGTRDEVRVAIVCGRPVFYSPGDGTLTRLDVEARVEIMEVKSV